MQINNIKRPWLKTGQNRVKSDIFYQTSSWKRIREIHKSRYTLVNGFNLPNIFCIQCYRDKKVFEPMHTVDHIIRIKSGKTMEEQEQLKYDVDNLQSLCSNHNAVKTAKEAQK